MNNGPNINTAEVAVVCMAALLLCILPNLFVWSDVRRRRRSVSEQLMQRRAVEVSVGAPVETMAAPLVADALAESPVEGAAVALEAPPAEASETAASVAATPIPEVTHAESVPTETRPSPFAPIPAADASARHALRLDELRRVKLPHWPPAEVRDNPEKKRIWEEAARVAEQPLITSMALKSPRVVESACLSEAESADSILRLHFLLFADMWPVAASQATAEAIFEIDSASGEVRGGVRAL